MFSASVRQEEFSELIVMLWVREKYRKSEEELKTMEKPMYDQNEKVNVPCSCLHF